MSPNTRTKAVEAIMNAQALNSRQRRALYCDSKAIDSALEHQAKAFQLVMTRPAEARTHIREASRLMLQALKDGDAEHPELREAAALVETPEEWSKSKVVDCTRRHLDVLVNPIRKSEHPVARAAVLAVIAAAGPELTGSYEHPDLRNVGHQLGKAKRTVLWNLVRERQQAAKS